MNIFKPTTFTWSQLGSLKWASIFMGIAIGATWPNVFAPYAIALFVVGLALAIPPGIAWLREH